MGSLVNFHINMTLPKKKKMKSDDIEENNTSNVTYNGSNTPGKINSGYCLRKPGELYWSA